MLKRFRDFVFSIRMYVAGFRPQVDGSWFKVITVSDPQAIALKHHCTTNASTWKGQAPRSMLLTVGQADRTAAGEWQLIMSVSRWTRDIFVYGPNGTQRIETLEGVDFQEVLG